MSKVVQIAVASFCLIVGGTAASPASGVTEQPAECTLTGTEGDDWLIGTPRADVICGLGGDDTIEGLGGDDIILAGSGYDLVSVEDNNATIQGGEQVIVESDVQWPNVASGEFAAASRQLGRLTIDDLPMGGALRVEATAEIICLSEGDLGQIYAAQAARNRAMFEDGTVDVLQIGRQDMMSEVVGAHPRGDEILAHTAIDGSTVLRVPADVDVSELKEAIDIAVAKAPAKVALDLLVYEAAIQGPNVSETERSATADWDRTTELLNVANTTFSVKIAQRCTDPTEVIDRVDEANQILEAIGLEPSTYDVSFHPITETVDIELYGLEQSEFQTLQANLSELLPDRTSVFRATAPEDECCGGRYNDGNPHWGGARISLSHTNGACTAGFAMTLNQNADQRLMATAGHCSSNGSGAVTGWEFQSANRATPPVDLGLYGTVAINALGNNNSTSADVALVGSNLVAFDRVVWVNENFDSRSVNARDLYLTGNVGSVCISGAQTDISSTSPIRCSDNTSFSLTTVEIQSDGGIDHDENVYTFESCTDPTVGGDSGSAVWQASGSGTIEINGMHISGGSRSVSQQVCPGYVLHRSRFLQVAEIQTRTQATVETWRGAGTSW